MFSNRNSNGKKQSLLEVMGNRDDLSTFAELLTVSGVAELFDEDRQFTVFAPTNDAFAKIATEKMNALVGEKELYKLKQLLNYHILPAKRSAAAISGMRQTGTMAGPDVRFSDRYGLKVNDAALGTRNIEARNGIVHVIDKVLAPPTAVAVMLSGSLL